MMSRLLTLASLVVAFSLSCWGMAQQGALLQAEEALQRGDFHEAVEKADLALRFKTPTSIVEGQAVFIKAEALQGLGRYEEASLLYRYLVAVHGRSPYAFQALVRIDELSARGVDTERKMPPAAELLDRLSETQAERTLVVDRPWLRDPVEIFYPFQAEFEGLEGSVLIELRSDAEGELSSYTILNATDSVFEDAAIGALSQFRFVPEEMAKSNPPNTRTIELDFQLIE